MKIFNFKNRRLFSGPHLLGTLLILSGFVALIGDLFFIRESSPEKVILVGGGAIILGLIIISSYSGTLIHFSGKRYKEYFSLGGYKFGEWTALPPILKVMVVSTSFIETNTPNGISPTLSRKVTDYRLLVYSLTSNPVLSFVYADKDNAIKQAKGFAIDFNADLELEFTN